MSHLVWMDLEMTGLNPEYDRIIEIATIVTDSELNVIEEGPVYAISQPQHILDGMDEWNQTHHSASGLLDRIKSEGVDIKEAEATTVAFLEKHVEERQAPYVATPFGRTAASCTTICPYLRAICTIRGRNSSIVSTLRQCGTMVEARPPVATVWTSPPISATIRSMIPSTRPA